MAKKVLLMFIVIALFAIPAMAQGNTGGDSGPGSSNKWIAIAAAFALAIASAVCGLAQGNALKAAADGISRNPGAADSIRGLLIIGLAFIESLAIYVLLIAFVLLFTKWGT